MAVKGYQPGSDKPQTDPAYLKRQDQLAATQPNLADASAGEYTANQPAQRLVNSTQRRLALTAEELKRFHQAMKASGQQHRQPRDIIWQDCWNLYNNEYDWSQKVWWQHKAPIPKVRNAVDKAVALFRKTLLKMSPFYGLKAESKIGRTKGRYTMLLNDYYFSQAKVINELVKAFKVGLITSTAVTKSWWMTVEDFKPRVFTDVEEIPTYEFGVQVGSQQQQTRRVELEKFLRGTLGFAAINPFNLWVIPGTRGRSVIERTELTLNEIQALVKTPQNPSGVYNLDAVAELKARAMAAPGPNSAYGEQGETNQEGRGNANEYLRPVCLETYWGDIYDTEGNLVLANASYSFAGFGTGDQVLVRDPRENPFYHKEHPFTIGTPYEIPFSTYNRGMVEDIAEIAKSIVEMANLIADGALYDAMKAFAIDLDAIDDPSEARKGVYPGKAFLYRSSQLPTPQSEVVQTINVGKIPQEANSMVGLFERYFQEGTFINEWVGGFGSKTDRTLGEVNIKTQAALEGLDEAARNLETTLIEPALAKATKVIYQFHDDYAIPRLMENYPQISMLLSEMTSPERYSTMVGDFTFEVRGLSIMIDRAQRIGEFKEILQLLSYLPGFLEQVNPITALEEIFAPVGWDPNKLLLNPSSGAAMIPIPGQQPIQQVVPPGQQPPNQQAGQGGRQLTPMNRANAQAGAQRGGAINNPNSAGMMNPQIIQRMIMQRLQAMRGRPSLGQPVF